MEVMGYFNLYTNNQSHLPFSKPRPPRPTQISPTQCSNSGDYGGIFLIQTIMGLLFLNGSHIAVSQKLSAIETEVCSRKERLTRLRLRFKKLKRHVAIVNWEINEMYIIL